MSEGPPPPRVPPEDVDWVGETVELQPDLLTPRPGVSPTSGAVTQSKWTLGSREEERLYRDTPSRNQG